MPPTLHSIPQGDLVLAMLPPVQAMNWLAMGVVRLAGILEQHGLQVRVTRVLPDWRDLPAAVVEAGFETVSRALPLELRLERARAAVDAQPGLLDTMVDALLAGPERVFGLSVWRNNVDLSLLIAQRLKQRRPHALVLLGGPEAIENGAELRLPWIDAVVSAPAEAHVLPLVQALLEGTPGRARGLPATWIHPRHPDQGPAPQLQAPDRAPVDYAALLPLLRADRQPHVPVLLNVGCPYHCGFCTNRPIYGEITWGEVETFVAEVQGIMQAWVQLADEGEDPPVLELCDAAMNGRPRQFEALCQALADADLPLRPRFRGMVVVDRRFDEALVESMIAAGFDFVFVGFESASPRVRQAMGKPGSIDDVRAGLQAAARVSDGRLGVALGVISGWPDETEAEHLDTMRFLEWFSQLDGLNTHAVLSPLYRVRAAQDQPVFDAMEGEAQGVLWTHPGPGGEPELRLRRLLGLFERLHGILSVEASVPADLLMRWMAPDLPPSFHAAWKDKHGRLRDWWHQRD